MVDHFTLWVNPVTDQALLNAETYYQLLYKAPPIHRAVLHAVICFGLVAHAIKLYGGNQSNLLFDSGSLILYVAGVIIYMVYLVQGMLHVHKNPFLQLAGLQAIFQHNYTPLSKLDTLQILAVSQVVLALILMGILVLQSSQFCAEQAVLHSSAFNKRPRKHSQNNKRWLDTAFNAKI